ncbi:hypothetical protein GCK72_005868 [Caenorhabditis remanei]|uniref:glutathione transferase n=2 Tax=Caenorhabditis remanei TaxID=31234 RepID=E3M458_CAERE|nr:hypothetical protein GCK72_005868 [Caenorhabditis remanei]EFO91469.1 CRE-GST-5 protein [Caenorhabditis remanei]KAF1765915.1 hypothetical protein GCK72_005868 [Caenorhabditis remanei]
MVSYKLTYFDGRGAGEVSRQILAYAGQQFEDKRVSHEQWPALKDSTPFGQLPVLEVDGKPLAQSHAIARFLAREFKLNGQNAWEEGQVNSLADQFKDYSSEAKSYFYAKMGFGPGDVETLKKDVFEPAFNKFYGFLSGFLKSSGSGFLVGNSLTWIDLAIAQHTADLVAQGADFGKFQDVKTHSEKIQSIPQIKKWIDSRPVTPF